jgi:hypothetical protein
MLEFLAASANASIIAAYDIAAPNCAHTNLQCQKRQDTRSNYAVNSVARKIGDLRGPSVVLRTTRIPAGWGAGKSDDREICEFHDAQSGQSSEHHVFRSISR